VIGIVFLPVVLSPFPATPRHLCFLTVVGSARMSVVRLLILNFLSGDYAGLWLAATYAGVGRATSIHWQG
jgi:hypothetical protein